MKTRAKLILKSLADLPGAVRSLAIDGPRPATGLTPPDSFGSSPSAARRAESGGPPAFMLAWSELEAARKFAAWRRGGINE
jgi:hypothetical protein